VLVPFGNFTGGAVILWPLKVVVEVNPGDVLFFMGAVTAHSTEAVTSGRRDCLHLFSRQHMFDWVDQRKTYLPKQLAQQVLARSKKAKKQGRARHQQNMRDAAERRREEKAVARSQDHGMSRPAHQPSNQQPNENLVKVNNPALYKEQQARAEQEKHERNRRVKHKKREEKIKRRQAREEGREYTTQWNEEDLAYKAERQEKNRQKREEKRAQRARKAALRQANATNSSAEVARQPGATVEQKPLPPLPVDRKTVAQVDRKTTVVNDWKPVVPTGGKPKVAVKKEPAVKAEKKREVIVLDD
jgi:hypothetical protein